MAAHQGAALVQMSSGVQRGRQISRVAFPRHILLDRRQELVRLDPLPVPPLLLAHLRLPRRLPGLRVLRLFLRLPRVPGTRTGASFLAQQRERVVWDSLREAAGSHGQG